MSASVTKNISVTDENIDDIMVTALEGGINYWCGSALPKDEDYKGADYASHAVSKGATLILTDVEDESEEWELTREKLLEGVSKYLSLNNPADIVDEETGELDACMIDADVADCILQLALFNEIVFG